MTFFETSRLLVENISIAVVCQQLCTANRNYGLCTSKVNELMRIIERSPEVYGERLMGAGFGGSVLALAKRESAHSLVDRGQKEFYKPRGRDGIAEGSTLVSTLGGGLSSLDLASFQTDK